MRPSVLLSPGALLLAGGLAVYPALDQSAALAPLLALAALAVLLYATALLRLWPEGLAAALALLAGEYVASLYFRGSGADVAAPAYAAALFLCAELGWLAVEDGGGSGLWPGRALGVAVVGLAGAGLGFALLLLGALPLGGGPLLTAAGGAAVLALFAALAALARAARSGGVRDNWGPE